MTETIRLPMGHGLYLDGVALGEEITTTQGELEIRNIENGELLATIPEPVVLEDGGLEPYIGTYFIQVYGPMVLLTTAVDSDWLLSEDRAYPLALDPTIKVTSGNRGYCYVYYGYCYNSTYGYLYRYYGSYYYLPWHRYAFQARLPYQAAQLLKRSTGSSTLTTHTEALPVRASRHESSRLVVPMHATTTESPPHPVRVRFLQTFCRDRIQTSMSES